MIIIAISIKKIMSNVLYPSFLPSTSSRLKVLIFSVAIQVLSQFSHFVLLIGTLELSTDSLEYYPKLKQKEKGFRLFLHTPLKRVDLCFLLSTPYKRDKTFPQLTFNKFFSNFR